MIFFLMKLTLRSPEILAPAKIPVAAGKKMENTEKNSSPLKSGRKFSLKVSAESKKIKINQCRDC